MAQIRTIVILSLLLSFLSAAHAGRLEISGRSMEGGLIIGHTQPGSVVRVDGRRVRVSEDGLFLIGFHRDEKKAVPVEVVFPDGKRVKKTLKVAQREYRIQRIDGLPKRKVTPEKMDWERIRAEVAMVKKARQVDSPRADFLDGFIWPVTGPISGVYGSQRILNGKPRQPHYGVDVAAPVGTPVRAPAGGVVTLAHDDMFYSGGTLMIDHGHGLSSSFLHLSRILVKVGERVEQGQVIAEVGATGRVTGPHLDWRMNWFEKRIDPTLLAGPMPSPGPTARK
jgi:murein DD-endopeptidase MepM/ murein hydrolase activator NlpD